MTKVNLGRFDQVDGVLLGHTGLSIWDRKKNEYCIEVRPPEGEWIKINGEFGEPPIEPGFVYVEGMFLPQVEEIRVEPKGREGDCEIRQLTIVSQGVDLCWELSVPCAPRSN